MPLGPQENAAPPVAPRRRTREHPAEGKWLGTAESTNERDVRGRGRRRRLRKLVSGGSQHWIHHWMVRYALLVLFVVLALLFVEAARAQDGFVAVPELKARVTDQAGMLTEQQKTSLESVLTDHETRTGSQIAVLLVKSTAPEAIEQYSIRVTDAWKLGRKGIDDGVLLVVAKDNPAALRRLRIEAGRGVQGSLTDAQSKRVLQDVIAPHFRNNDYYGGLTAGVSAIATLLDKEQFPAPEKSAAQPAQHESGVSGWLVPALLFGAFVLLPMLRGGRGRRGLRSSGWGSDAAGVLIGAAIGNALGQRSGGSFSGGGGFGGGGGFSGGSGGSFDGGGASGDW